MANQQINKPRESFDVSFIIQSAKLDFEAISEAINITPSYIHRAGDSSLIKTLLPHDMWAITSPSLEEQEEPFDACLKWLAQHLKPHYDFIKLIKKSSEVYIRCGLVTEREQTGFTLSPEAMELLTELKIPLHLSLLAI